MFSRKRGDYSERDFVVEVGVAAAGGAAAHRGRGGAGGVVAATAEILVGNLGRDPEIRSTNDGTRIANLNLATSESWRDRNSGERKERTEWHRVVIFNERLVEIAEKYLKKGSKIYVEGALQTRKWTDQQGVERYSTEVVLQNYNSVLTMLDKAGGGGGDYRSDESGDFGASGPTAARERAPAMAGGKRGDMDDEIPF